jgi:hypothetical protein
MTVSVGLSKKIGTANYGSVGASCNIEFEADHDLLKADPEGFQQRVRNAYAAVRQAVQDELARQQVQAGGTDANGNHANANAPIAPATTPSNGNSRSSGNGHRISEKQLTFIRQLAGSIKGLGVRRLDTLSTKMFNRPMADLSSLDGSGLIDVLKDVKAGKIDLDSVLSGGAA